ncbi:hypothetical protein ACLOJK_008583, partial [Asimina triloba]
RTPRTAEASVRCDKSFWSITYSADPQKPSHVVRRCLLDTPPAVRRIANLLRPTDSRHCSDADYAFSAQAFFAGICGRSSLLMPLTIQFPALSS